MGRRGPKTKKGKREPNGRLSRRLEDEAAKALAETTALDLTSRELVAQGIAARFRVHEHEKTLVAVEDGIDQKAGAYVGRLRMAGQLTETGAAA